MERGTGVRLCTGARLCTEVRLLYHLGAGVAGDNGEQA